MGKLLLLVLLLPGLVLAAKKPPMMMSQTPTLSQKQSQESWSTSSADSFSESISESASMAASDSSSSNGDMTSLNSSQFYALSLMFPQAAGCFTGVQGGLNEDQKGGFLGIHMLNNSCWMNKLAAMEPDIELNARLLCGDRKYRNAIAYEYPRKERREQCISMKMDSGIGYMQDMKQEMERLKGRNAEIMAEHALIVQECEDADARGDERLARCEQTLKMDDK